MLSYARFLICVLAPVCAPFSVRAENCQSAYDFAAVFDSFIIPGQLAGATDFHGSTTLKQYNPLDLTKAVSNVFWHKQIIRTACEIQNLTYAVPDFVAELPIKVEIFDSTEIDGGANDRDINISLPGFRYNIVLRHELFHLAIKARLKRIGPQLVQDFKSRGIAIAGIEDLGFFFTESLPDTYGFIDQDLADSPRPIPSNRILSYENLESYRTTSDEITRIKASDPMRAARLELQAIENGCKPANKINTRRMSCGDAHAAGSILHSLLAKFAQKTGLSQNQIFKRWFEQVLLSATTADNYYIISYSQMSGPPLVIPTLSPARVLTDFERNFTSNQILVLQSLRSEWQLDDVNFKGFRDSLVSEGGVVLDFK